MYKAYKVYEAYEVHKVRKVYEAYEANEVYRGYKTYKVHQAKQADHVVECFYLDVDVHIRRFVRFVSDSIRFDSEVTAHIPAQVLDRLPRNWAG